MAPRAFITGTSGTTLTKDERAFIATERPWGFILFRRNIDNPAQVTELVAQMRDAADAPDAPVLVDQEGGQVQRFRPPHWPNYPSGGAFGQLYDIDSKLGLPGGRLRG